MSSLQNTVHRRSPPCFASSSWCLVAVLSALLAVYGPLADSFKEYEKNFRMLPADSLRGPTLVFLDPVLKPLDVRVLASGREPTRCIRNSEGLDSIWVWTWQRVPDYAGPRISLEAHFQNQRMTELAVDRHFSQALGDGTVSLLVESFVSGDTDLDLSSKRVTCHLNEAQLLSLPEIDRDALTTCFGKVNRRQQNKEMPGLTGYYYRYQLLSAPEGKRAMSFHAWIDPASDRLRYITMRIGGFRISFDFSSKAFQGDRLATPE